MSTQNHSNGLDILRGAAQNAKTTVDLSEYLMLASSMARLLRTDLLQALTTTLYADDFGKVPSGLRLGDAERMLDADAHVFLGDPLKAKGVSGEQVQAVVGALRSLDATAWAVGAAADVLAENPQQSA